MQNKIFTQVFEKRPHFILIFCKSKASFLYLILMYHIFDKPGFTPRGGRGGGRGGDRGGRGGGRGGFGGRGGGRGGGDRGGRGGGRGTPRGRGAPRGGRGGRGGGRGGPKAVVVEPHRHDGVFVARGKEDALVTLNMVPGEGVYGEKRVSVEVEGSDKGKVEYRIWNPFRSKLAAAVLGGVDKIHMPPGSKVLYLGAASGTSVSHVSDIVGPVSTFIQVSVKMPRTRV